MRDVSLRSRFLVSWCYTGRCTAFGDITIITGKSLCGSVTGESLCGSGFGLGSIAIVVRRRIRGSVFGLARPGTLRNRSVALVRPTPTVQHPSAIRVTLIAAIYIALRQKPAAPARSRWRLTRGTVVDAE